MVYFEIEDAELEQLTHHGVKGMKWGVRRTQTQLGNKPTRKEKKAAKKVAKADKEYEKSLSGMAGFVKIQNSFANNINPKLESLNSNSKYQVDLLDPKNAKTYKSYLKDYEKAVKETLDDTMKEIGSNASGTKRLKLVTQGEGAEMTWYAEMEDLEHADSTDELRLEIKPKFNKKGQIIGQATKVVTKSATLEHYGVKGMKWGVTRSREQLAAAAAAIKDSRKTVKKIDVQGKDGKSSPALLNKKTKNIRTRAPEDVDKEESKKILDEFGTGALSNKQLQSYATRVELERRVSNLETPKKSLVSKIIENEKKTIVDNIMANPLDVKGAVKRTNGYRVGKFLVTASKKAAEKKRSG